MTQPRTTQPDTPGEDRIITMRLTGERVRLHDYRVEWLTRLTHSVPFEAFISIVIGLNALALALLTMPNVPADIEAAIMPVNLAAYAVFIAELVLRIASYGRKPWMFFRHGWNVFDFIVISAGLLPLMQRHVAILRLLRLLRLVRIFRFLPEVRVLSASILKSLLPLASMSVLIALLMFLYGMSGTYLFGDEIPEHWGNILISLNSLLALLTLDNFGDYFTEGVGVTPLAVPFFLSYLFIIVFTVLNVLVGIVLHAMDQARTDLANEQPAVVAVSTVAARIQAAAADGTLSPAEITVLKAELDALQASLDAAAEDRTPASSAATPAAP